MEVSIFIIIINKFEKGCAALSFLLKKTPVSKLVKPGDNRKATLHFKVNASIEKKTIETYSSTSNTKLFILSACNS